MSRAPLLQCACLKEVRMDAALIKKLQIKPGYRVLVLNAPDGYLERLTPLPEGATVTHAPGGGFDVVHAFAGNQAELNKIAPIAIAAVKPGGVLWFSYPKQSAKVATDITRDRGWELVTGAGLRGVTQIAIDDTWSALRFRPATDVRSRRA
jgi:hypothetical protein